MGAAGSSEKPTEEKKEPLADAKAAEEMAVRQPNEASPLVGGVSDETLTSAKEKMQAGISLASLVIIAVVKVQVTARLFESAHYPTAYSMWSCVITCICLVPLFIARPSLWAVPTWEMKDVLTLIVVFTAADLGFTNIALANIPTAVQQSIASTNPFWTILLETFLYRKYAHIVTYVTVVLIIIGAILAAQAPSHRDGNATLGLASACIAVLCSASKAVFTHSAFKKFKSQMGAMPLLFWVDIFMLPFYIVATLILQSEGRPELVTFFGTRTHSRIHAHNTQTHHQHHLRAHTHKTRALSFLARSRVLPVCGSLLGDDLHRRIGRRARARRLLRPQLCHRDVDVDRQHSRADLEHFSLDPIAALGDAGIDGRGSDDRHRLCSLLCLYQGV